MTRWLLAAVSLTCAAAEPDLSLDVRLDPTTRQFSAVAELPRAPGDFRFTPHSSLAVRNTARLASGALRIEYGGVLPPLERSIDFRGVLKALPPMASPEGSFLGAGSGWYPRPAALFTYRVRLHLPPGQKGLAPGHLVAESASDATFEFTSPTDGIDLMAGPYEVREKLLDLDGKRVRLRTYFFKEISDLADGYLDDSARYLERYSRSIGAYPFTQFSIVASPLPSGFGMPTLTYIGAAVLKLPFIRATSLGHEVLHNWWGNGVLVDYARGNWSEGLTTFMADYAYKEDESPEAARDMRLGWLRDLAALPAGAQRPLAAFRSRTHGAEAVVGYGKSAMLFFMLRDSVGEEAFARGVRRFWEGHRFKSASWDELRAAFEGASGRDLERFFAQWLQRAGAPSVQIASARQTSAGVAITLTQSAPAYSLRLPVEALFSGSAETRWVEVVGQKHTVVLDFKEMPDAVRLDPELRVYRRLERDELPPILREWIIARAPELMKVSSVHSAVAEQLFEAPFREVSQPGREPLLVVGLHADVDAALARLRLPPRPASLAGKGSAQVWTIPGTKVAVVSASDAPALEAISRPLPHYGSQSWLAFDGARVTDRGAWPPAVRSVPVSGRAPRRRARGSAAIGPRTRSGRRPA